MISYGYQARVAQDIVDRASFVELNHTRVPIRKATRNGTRVRIETEKTTGIQRIESFRLLDEQANEITQRTPFVRVLDQYFLEFVIEFEVKSE